LTRLSDPDIFFRKFPKLAIMGVSFLHNGESERLTAQRWFLAGAAAVLAITSAAKLITILGESKGLRAADPLFLFLTVRQTLFIAAALELATLFCIARSSPKALGMTACISTIFLAYRTGLWLLNVKLCGCLGRFTESMGLSPEATNTVVFGALIYLCLGSWSLLTRNAITSRSVPNSVQVKTQV
jgi:hypothetical protein